jgi:hypothetical protein
VQKDIALIVSPAVVSLSLLLSATSGHSHVDASHGLTLVGRPLVPRLATHGHSDRDLGIPSAGSAYRGGRFPWLPEVLFDGLDMLEYDAVDPRVSEYAVFAVLTTTAQACEYSNNSLVSPVTAIGNQPCHMSR